MTGIVVTAPELPRLDAILVQLLERNRDRAPLMDSIGQYMETATDQHFDTETAPDGARWPKSIRAREEGGKTLTDTARLRQSITHNASDDQVEVGTNVIYGATHQGGAVIRGKSGPLKFRLPGGLGFRSMLQVIIPARPFLGVNGEDEREIVAIGEDYFGEGLDL